MGPLCLGVLLCLGAGRPALAGVAPVSAPVRLGSGLGMAAAVPLVAPGFRLDSYRGLALSLLAPGAPTVALPAPVPALPPALLPAAPAVPESRPVPALQGLTGVSGELAADQAQGGKHDRTLLDGFFDVSRARYAAPAVSGLPEPRIPSDYLPLPVTVQETSYSCGAAAALSVLRYWQAYGGDERSLYKLLGTRPKDGTPPQGIAHGLSHLGLPAEVKEGMTLDDLRAALRRGDSVILDIQAWRNDEDTPWSQRWEDGHYVVLAGMDEHYAYLMDPSTPERYT